MAQREPDAKLKLQRELSNSLDPNAIKVLATWTTEKKRRLLPSRRIVNETHVGYVPADLAAEVGRLSLSTPIAAELFKIAVDDEPNFDEGAGLIIKMIVLVGY
ncbi:MAG: hypothetical protein EOO38_22570 [Cytophagaceae bacterium]|nr:MAG: hypothetical protein EOO38_22570 [Cytophagaceae bacterium]